MKTILIIGAILVWSTVCYAEDPKVYTDQDLKKYGTAAEKKDTGVKGKMIDPCTIFYNKFKQCDQHDLKCMSYWGEKYSDCNVRVKPVILP